MFVSFRSREDLKLYTLPTPKKLSDAAAPGSPRLKKNVQSGIRQRYGGSKKKRSVADPDTLTKNYDLVKDLIGKNGGKQANEEDFRLE